MAEWKKILYSGSAANLSSLNVDGAVTAGSFTGNGSGLTGITGVTSEYPLNPLADSLNVPYHMIQKVQGFSPNSGGNYNATPVLVMDEVDTIGPSTGSWITGFMDTKEMQLGQRTTTTTTTGPQYGGVTTNQSDATELVPWGTTANSTVAVIDGSTVAVGWFIYAETSTANVGYPNILNTLRTPKFSIPAGKTEKFIMYYHAYGATIGTFKVYRGSNPHNRDAQAGMSFRWWNGSAWENSTEIEGEQHEQSDKNFYRIEVTLSGEGYLYLDYTSGTSHTGDFALDCCYLDSDDTALDFNLPDEDGVYSTRVRILPDGEAHFDGDVVAYSSTISDERLKENILPITNSLSAVKNLQGVSYDLKYKPGPRQVGLLAQQVESQIPEVVKEYDLPFTGGPKSDTPYKTVSYQLLVPHLIEAIKELNARIEELESLSDK